MVADMNCGFLANGSLLTVTLRPGELTLVMGDGLVPVVTPQAGLIRIAGLAFHASALDAVVAAQPPNLWWRWARQSPGAERSAALACLARVDLLDRALFPVASLNAAERLRVALAALLMRRARLLIVADPDGDPFDVADVRFLFLLRAVSQEQERTAVVFTATDRAVADLFDRVVVIAESYKVFDGAPHALPAGLRRAEPLAAMA